MPLHNNDIKRDIRDKIVPDRNRSRLPDMKGVYHFAVMRTIVATCQKNDISLYQYTMMMAKDPTYDIFNHAIPPPIFGTSGDTTTDDDVLGTRGARTSHRLP